MRISDWSSDVCSSDLNDDRSTREARKWQKNRRLTTYWRLPPSGGWSAPLGTGRTCRMSILWASAAFAATAWRTGCWKLPMTTTTADRRVGKECVRTVRHRWQPEPHKNTQQNTNG